MQAINLLTFQLVNTQTILKPVAHASTAETSKYSKLEYANYFEKIKTLLN